MNDLVGSSILAILQNLIASFLAVVFGIAFTQFIRRRWDKRRYGGWYVIVKKKEVIKVNRAISVRKAQEILDEPRTIGVLEGGRQSLRASQLRYH